MTLTPEEMAAFAFAPPAVPPAPRQPVHTVYGGAHLFDADTPVKLGRLARRAMEEHAPDADTFAAALGLATPHAAAVHTRVVEKLAREPVEDLRVDFEDGFGDRPDEEEDHCAVRSAGALGASTSLPRGIGLRVKSMDAAARSLRTLDLFLTTLGPRTPPHLRVTLPKVSDSSRVSAFVRALSLLESRLGLPRLAVELMIETPAALFARDGRGAIPALLAAADGRCVAAHFGPYDYTAALDITAASQRLSHPACDFARQALQVLLAGTGVALSDGPTNVMPIGPHRGTDLTPPQAAENRRAVHAAWRLHAEHVRRALDQGIYQGWDLHPAQLPARYGAVYAFFLDALPAATERLSRFVARAAQATRTGQVFDDAATGQGLLNFFLRGLACGALTEAEALATGLSTGALAARSFTP